MRYAFLFSVLALMAGCAETGTEVTDPRYEEAASAIGYAIAFELEDKDLPGFGVVLVDDQDIVWSRGFRYQDPDEGVPASPETVYRVASISKLFTDIGIMQLVERGELDLDAPISTYLSDFHPQNPYNTPITLRQLMSHRSGLIREPLVGNYFEDTEPSLAATVQSLNGSTLLYEPGTNTSYSNGGIAVAGYVLETVSGQPFTQYLQEAVLEPFGMHNSAFYPREDLADNLAKAYMWTLDGREFEAPYFQMGMAPAASMYAPLPDLAQFMKALFNKGMGPDGPVLKPETLEQMWTPQLGSQRFGIGFGLGTQQGHRRIGHAGAIYGFSTRFFALQDEKLGVAMVATMDGTNNVADRLATYALDVMLAVRAGKPIPDYLMPEAIPPATQQSLTGVYSSDNSEATLYRMQDDLWLRLRGQTTRLRQLHPDTLISDSRHDYGMRVIPTENGFLINNTLFSKRTPEKPAPVPSRWEGLLGAYGWDHNTLYIFEKAGQLHTLIEWFYEYPLEEQDENTFAFPNEGLYPYEALVFERDASGVATQVELEGGTVFERRSFGDIEGGTFRIDPVQPVEILREAALAAEPPKEAGTFRDTDLIELTTLDPTLKLDIRYATTNNFMSAVFYDEARAFMQRPAAEAVARVHQKLAAQGYGLLIYDAYRPWYVTRMFWDATPEAQKIFVANPANGSRHNRGCAVDLTLFDLATGEPIEMTGGYDEFSERSFPEYPGGTDLQRWHRQLLREAMEAEGFSVYEHEWWHFDYKEWPNYRIGNVLFDEIG